MKTKTLRKKMVLNKETIADLGIGKMMNVHGGILTHLPAETDTCVNSCGCSVPTGNIDCRCNIF